MQPARQSHRAFTLIELLVVIAIVAVLVAAILPALGRAKLVARRAQAQSNLHQVAIGFLFYANLYDKDRLRSSITHVSGYAAQYAFADRITPASPFYSAPPYRFNHDLRPIFTIMQLTPLTKHPVTGFPAIDSTANSGAPNYSRYLPWFYWPGYEMTSYSTTRTLLQAPTRVVDATSKHVLMNEMLQYRPDSGLYGTLQTDDPSAIPLFGQIFLTNRPLGTFAATYDGAVRMRYWNDFLPTASSNIWVQVDSAGTKLANLQR